MERERLQYAFLGWILLCLLGWCTVQGVYAAQDDTASKSSMAREATLPEYVDVTTQHVIRLDGQDMAYTTTAGALTIPVEGGESQGKLFYVAYVKRDADAAQRPITFVFNGGPGAAAVYLHLGAIGPRRVALNDDGTVPPAPVRLVQNSLTWLAFTDVVFVDPIGTGYSRAARKSDGKDKTHKFWGIEADLESLGGFIRLYLSRNSRWLSPKFLAGESYGGFRVAALAQKLHAEFHVPLNGLVLISPALEFSLHTVDHYRVLPWVLRIPAYAAVATFHGKSSLQRQPASELSALLSPVEAFSLGDLLTGLAQGDRLGEEKAHVLYHRLSGYLGLSDELVRRYRGRIALSVFAKTLLRDSQRVISLYDGSVATQQLWVNG
jgi:carboxypeptidase C (cathepsin A)